MSRVAQFLAGVSVVAAATANVNCSSATACSSCVGTGLAQVCANYEVPPAPACIGCGTGLSAGPCSAATSATAACSVCVSVLQTSLGACVTTTANVAPYLTANSTFSAGLDINVFAGGATLVQLDVSASGSVDVPTGNAVVVLGAAPITTLNGNANGNNIFQLNSSLQVGAWNNAGSAKVNNNDNVELKVGHLMVGGSSSKFSVAQEKGASVRFESINFSGGAGGRLQVAGGAAYFGAGATPNAAVASNITGSGRVQLSNGVSVHGNLPSAVTVSVDASGTNAPLVTVDTGATFNVSGDLTTTKNGDTTMTANANAVLAVNGIFVAGSASTKVEPKVILNKGSSFVINSAATFRAEAVEIGAEAALVIGANADRANMRIKQIAKCAGVVRINLAVTAEAFIASSASNTAAGGKGSVAFSYDNTNNVNELVKCGVEVYDSSNRKYTLTSRTSAQAAAGRRLLASDGSATWGEDSMTFEMQRQTSSAPVSFAVVPLLIVSMAGLLL